MILDFEVGRYTYEYEAGTDIRSSKVIPDGTQKAYKIIFWCLQKRRTGFYSLYTMKWHKIHQTHYLEAPIITFETTDAQNLLYECVLYFTKV